MYFVDRVTLGNMLADKLEKYRKKGAVIVCLKEGSLLTCLTIAKHLRAWVYPLIFEPVYSPDGSHVLMGAFDQEGAFFGVGNDQTEDKQSAETKQAIKSQWIGAQTAIRQRLADYDLTPNKHLLNGRDVIIAGDILMNPLPVVIVQQLLKSTQPKSLTAVVGNTTPDVAQLIRLSVDESIILDIVSGVISDDDHYFDHPDTYTAEQKHRVTQHIVAYWQ